MWIQVFARDLLMQNFQILGHFRWTYWLSLDMLEFEYYWLEISTVLFFSSHSMSFDFLFLS